ncbi:hypothetical protein [Arthrobacter sp. 131MFCol6.1]|uniref:hypothetical protein n=1 Tax=Arthrobacter sp. 131MFCol6.1 TaxID=1157944 RepID=UPI000360A8BA|nr:hypothetical protein [Arthrobacter sp. 131MFCol6.1]
MELLILGIAAVLIVIATIIRDLRQKSCRMRTGSDPESERALRDFKHGRTVGLSHFVGLDNTGHRR